MKLNLKKFLNKLFFLLIKIVRKINEDTETIKKLLQKRLSQNQISKLLGLKFKRLAIGILWYKNILSRKKKLSLLFINKICNLAKDKTTSDIGSKKIAALNNIEFKEKNILNSKGKILEYDYYCSLF